MQKVFTKKYMIVFKRELKDEYVVYNSKKQWEEGHTHIHNYDQALYLVDCILKCKIPKKVNKYFLVSLTRLATDKKYIENLQRIIKGEEPPQIYVNRRVFLKR